MATGPKEEGTLDGADNLLDAATPFADAAAKVIADTPLELVSGVFEAIPLIGGFVKIGLIAAKWSQGAAAAREKNDFESVIFEAARALHDDDPELAAAAIEAHIEDPDFRSLVHAAVNQMREGKPCQAAHRALGLLIAEYQGRGPDPLFRGVSGLLADASPTELAALPLVVEGLLREISSNAKICFRINAATPADPRVDYRKFTGKGDRVQPSFDVKTGDIRRLHQLLLDHRLADVDVPSGVLNDHSDKTFAWIQHDVLGLLSTVLGLRDQRGGPKVP